ncbi:unnamed protein product [Parascedosporium putredinis]|uniref:Mtf2-like C-terminal domain-containing protein n=1 Tax=Parascedosporium putredinis TaxID=1442378 RepID=A0A9P1GXF3_9PEZI|nr:unnamed protein product [Parascedosporium putredinis]CAI7988966.1 unnamed protein product [Parascedosporium putredinis]
MMNRAMSSTLLPFLYQTRTLRRAIQRPLRLSLSFSGPPHLQPQPRQPFRSAHSGPPRRPNRSADEESIPFEFGPDQADAAAAAARQKQRQTSTMTDAEKRVFDEIFGDITKRRRQFGNPLPGVVPSELTVQETTGKIRSVTLPGSAADVEEKEWTREEILAMYPPALRRAAESALGLQEDDDGGIAFDDGYAAELGDEHDDAGGAGIESGSDAEAVRGREDARAAERAALVALHRDEKARVVGAMQQCASDVALWQLMEREHGPLYSVHLLSGLRLLDRGFGKPSPLALAVLPRILELGMASYVLGVSTRFYNELMSIYWYRYGDTDEVMRLLREMERAGMSADGQTLRLLDVVVDALEGAEEYDSIMVSKLKKRRAWVLDCMRERAEELPL